MNTTNNIKVSSNTDTVDDISKGIGEVTIADNDDDVPNNICGDIRSEVKSSEKKCTSCEQNLEHTETNEIGADNTPGTNDCMVLKAVDSLDILSKTGGEICASCGKEGASNTCNKCEQAKYCNATCKKKHRPKHKKACERRVNELHDIELFKQPPQEEDDCPICFQRLPLLCSGSQYNSCCGKMLCCGCIHAMDMEIENRKGKKTKLCPFCRTPAASSGKEIIKQLMKRVDIGDADAISILGYYYSEGMYLPQEDMNKAFEYWHRAVELGHVGACYRIGNAYQQGRGVNRDMKKAAYYWERAAMKGDANSRYNLGVFEYSQGNTERALKHWLISVMGGDDSLKQIQNLYSQGKATKDDFAKALLSYQKYLDEAKSTQRDQAAAARKDYKYIE